MKSSGAGPALPAPCSGLGEARPARPRRPERRRGLITKSHQSVDPVVRAAILLGLDRPVRHCRVKAAYGVAGAIGFAGP
jgi:hypothetical protein